MMAASLQRLAISAPLNPGESSDNLLATSEIDLSGSILRGLRWTLNIYYLALISGSVTSTSLSNLPGRIKALSRVSLRLVAANTMTVYLLLKPSISTKSWFRVESFSSFLEDYLLRPIASISSMKIIEGAYIRALANNYRTLAAPIPTNI